MVNFSYISLSCFIHIVVAVVVFVMNVVVIINNFTWHIRLGDLFLDADGYFKRKYKNKKTTTISHTLKMLGRFMSWFSLLVQMYSISCVNVCFVHECVHVYKCRFYITHNLYVCVTCDAFCVVIVATAFFHHSRDTTIYVLLRVSMRKRYISLLVLVATRFTHDIIQCLNHSFNFNQK